MTKLWRRVVLCLVTSFSCTMTTGLLNAGFDNALMLLVHPVILISTLQWAAVLLVIAEVIVRLHRVFSPTSSHLWKSGVVLFSTINIVAWFVPLLLFYLTSFDLHRGSCSYLDGLTISQCAWNITAMAFLTTLAISMLTLLACEKLPFRSNADANQS